jgi:competence protein ComEC
VHDDRLSSASGTLPDAPAAYPLLGLICGLAAGPWLQFPLVTVGGTMATAALALIPWRWRQGASLTRLRGFVAILLFFAAGVAATIRVPPHPQFDPDRFVTIELPLERDWAERDGTWMVHGNSFIADGITVEEPISVYVRFAPPAIAMEQTLRAEALLRPADHGGWSASVKSAELMAYRGELVWWKPATWNRKLARRLETQSERYPGEVALAEALLLGRGERLTPEMRESFRRGGTYHLLVFSGLQIAFAAGVLAALLRWLGAPRLSDWLLLLFAALAPPFIGTTASVSRASIAIGFYALSRILRRPTSLENLWCVAALLHLLLNPKDLTSLSFQLTYAGAGSLLFIGKWLRPSWPSKNTSRRMRLVRFTARGAVPLVAAEVTLTPLTLFHFHQFALAGSLVTLIMAPAIFAMLIASAVACAWPARVPFESIRLLHRLCTVLNRFGFAGWFAAPPLTTLVTVAFAALIALALLTGRRRAAALFLLLLIPSLAAVQASRSAGRIESPRVTFLDVGQGDSILVRTAARTILVDGGRSDRVLTLLADHGVRRIDVAILTHAHPDHCGGLARVLEEMEVGSVWISPRRFEGECADLILAAISHSSTSVFFVRDGTKLNMEGLHLQAYLADRRFRRAPENNSSIVLHGTIGGRTFLLTGDIEREAELTLDDRDLSADVLKVAHHGSRTSTSAAFLGLVKPRLAVISCGRRNLFGHPHPAVLSALHEAGARVWRTDLDGSIDVEVLEGRLYVWSAID